MSKQLSIQSTYHDALFFASAYQNKNKAWYLTPSTYKVLIKLIHHSTTYEDVTFQNKHIASHIFLSESTVKDCIEWLANAGYITTKRDIFNNRLGYKSKRTIFINWTFIQTIYDLIGVISSEEIITIESATEIDSTSNTDTSTNSISELKSYLKENSNGLKHLKMVLLEGDITNGTITTIEQLKEELA